MRHLFQNRRATGLHGRGCTGIIAAWMLVCLACLNPWEHGASTPSRNRIADTPRLQAATETARPQEKKNTPAPNPGKPVKKPLNKTVKTKTVKTPRAPQHAREATCVVSASRRHAPMGSVKLPRAAHGAELAACVKRKQGSTLPSLDLPS